MSATAYSADLRDIRFVLYEQLDVIGRLAAFEKHADLDRELVDTLIDEAYRIASEVLGPINAAGDTHGCKLDGEGNVTTPPGYKEAWGIVSEGGWNGFAAPPEHGGMGMPIALDVMLGEFWTGACVAFSMYGGLSRGAANVLVDNAPQWIRDVACERIYSGEWTGTMCLTEPGAGSDVGSNRARALPTDDPDVFEITGEKIFISCGDSEFSTNVTHLVLARMPDAPDGTRGLSIFMVPKYLFDADGNLGERNGAYVEAIEHKMGIAGSATCTISFGARSPCKGWLLGKAGQGMKIMFQMMNEARLLVAVQGLAGAATAYEMSKAYTKERVQGTDLGDLGNDAAKAVTIVSHPDVRRMLMWQKVHVETMRSLCYKTALRIDIAHNETDPDKRREATGYVELMTPVLKAYCSDKGFDSAVIGLQCYGGYGYIKEYPLEQIVRDTKIASIYEGTNGIQAMDLVGRKMQKGSGVLFMNWLAEVNAELDRAREIESLAGVVAAVEKARDALGASAMHLGGLGMQGNIKGAMLQASSFLDQFGCTALAVEALEQARMATLAMEKADISDSDRRYYKGKLLNARFYADNVLPRAIAVGKVIRSNDESCMDESLFI